MNPSALCAATVLPCSPRPMTWWRRLFEPPLQAGGPRHAPPPSDLDLLSLAHLSDAVLKDIGVPDGVRHSASQQREQAALLRQVEAHHGGAGVSRW